MGQAFTKCLNPDATSDDGGGAIDPALLKPTGLYENQAAHFRKSQVKKHILEGRIAPFYPYKEEDPEMELEECSICLLQAREASEVAAARSRVVEQRQHGAFNIEPSTSVQEGLPSVQESTPADMPGDLMQHLSRQGMHAPMHGPLDTPLQEENIQSSPKQTYNINVTDGSSPTQPSGSCSIKRKEGDAGPSHIPWMPPTTQPLIGMVFCRYNSAPLPPLFAMLAAISGSDAPDGPSADQHAFSTTQAAKDEEVQKRKEETAAAIAAAKAATYWAPSDDHDAAVLAAIEQEDAIIRERLAQQLSAPYETGSSSPSSSRQQTSNADDSFEARCRAADEALTAFINRRDAEAAARESAGQP
ncbi:hypothetical protein WJX75_001039 [Coccomyxa subellipsoidea]|uniref:Uncharacterized protein n=1 Tax=Coccomyxa subellipsoidea TaxID=248742 RepID=A0ABR2YZN9_9CHLO